MGYSYKVYQEEVKKEHIRYTRCELEKMGTFMLWDICIREKIMTRGAGIQPQRMEREELIELLYRYRGRKEARLKDEFLEESNRLLEKMQEKIFLTSDKIEIPFKITVKKEIPITPEKEIQIIHSFEGEYFCAILLDANGQVRAVFEVEGQSLTLSPKRMDAALKTGMYYDWQFILFDAESSKKVVETYNKQAFDPWTVRSITAVKAKLPVFVLEDAVVSEWPLFIDFGTSNTCAATVNEEGNVTYIKFQKNEVMYPSCAAVKQCGDQKAELVFGYQALSLLGKDGFGNELSFLYNLKKLLYEEQALELQDQEGSTICISSDLVLRDYFISVINTAKEQTGVDFHEIRVLMTEKRGGFVLERMQSILPGYRIEAAESESLNCVYQEIAARLEKLEEVNRLPVLVLHCGGGTSSLIRCDYQVLDTGVTYEVLLSEQFLNGDSGFGGNQLTYLIMKYLKILFYFNLTGRKEDILGDLFIDAYTWVDETGTTEVIYKQFNSLYEEAELFIPTRFKELDEFRKYKKQNFCRLWFLAEQIKIRFAGTELSVIHLPGEYLEYCGIHSFRDNRILETVMEAEIQRDAIWLVIAPEIYCMIKKLLEPYCNQDDILQGYRIKFSGLSCNIPGFKDAVREFTVGRRARPPKSGRTALKLRSIEGALWQEQLLKSGRVEPEAEHMPAAVSYTVTAQAHDGSSYPIISEETWENTIFGAVTRHISTRQVEFQVRDVFMQTVRSRMVELERASFRKTDYKQLFDEFPFLKPVQGEIDSIGEKDIRLFVFREDNWDFCILPVSRSGGILYRDEVSRFLFDDNSLEFFDGQY